MTFEVFKNPRGDTSGEVRIKFRGPMQMGGDATGLLITDPATPSCGTRTQLNYLFFIRLPLREPLFVQLTTCNDIG